MDNNLVLACYPCNQAKGMRTVDEYRRKLEIRTGQKVAFYGEREVQVYG